LRAVCGLAAALALVVLQSLIAGHHHGATPCAHAQHECAHHHRPGPGVDRAPAHDTHDADGCPLCPLTNLASLEAESAPLLTHSTPAGNAEPEPAGTIARPPSCIHGARGPPLDAARL
jgi:hypothetical protein